MQSAWDALCDYTDELMATGRYPGRHEAMLEAQRRTRTWTRPRPA